MKNLCLRSFSAFLALGLLFLWGCQGKQPASPNRMATLSFSVPINKEVKASLLGSTSNELLYKITGPGISPVGGLTYPFSASVSTGSIDFSVDVPAGVNGVLALQLNDATTHQALAVGAAQLNLSGSSPVTDVTVNLGSLITQCNTTIYTNLLGGSYGFATDIMDAGQTLIGGPTYDVTCYPVSTGIYHFVDAQTGSTSSIAYMGGGNLVDYAYVPTDNYFSYDSAISKSYVQSLQAPAPPTPTPTPSSCVSCGSAAIVASSSNPNLEVGDVYCLKLASIPGGHAWIQITSLAVSLVTGGFGGPGFCFRTNSTLPYYSYELTPAAQSVTGPCVLGSSPW